MPDPEILLDVKDLCVEYAAPRGLFSRQPALHLRFCRYQVGKAFHFDEIHATVQKGAPGEFSRFSRPQSLQLPQRRQDGPHGRPPAMNLEFGAVFTREGIRRGEKEDQALVQLLTVPGPNRA